MAELKNEEIVRAMLALQKSTLTPHATPAATAAEKQIPISLSNILPNIWLCLESPLSTTDVSHKNEFLFVTDMYLVQ